MKKRMLVVLLVIINIAILYSKNNGSINPVIKAQIAQSVSRKLSENNSKVVINKAVNSSEIIVIQSDNQHQYKNTEKYVAKYEDFDGFWYKIPILINNGKIYRIGKEFNYFLQDEKIYANEESFIKIAEIYLKTVKYFDFDIEQLYLKEGYHKGDTLVYTPDLKPIKIDPKKAVPYKVEAIIRTKRNGIRIKYNFKFKDGQLYSIRCTYLEYYQGDYIPDSNFKIGLKGSTNEFYPMKIRSQRTRNKSIDLLKNYDGSTASNITYSHIPNKSDKTFSNRNIVLNNNDVATLDSERIVHIYVQGYEANSTVSVEFNITSATDNYIVPYPTIIIPVDSYGDAIYQYLLPSEWHTGKLEITDCFDPDVKKYFFIYNTLETVLPQEDTYSSKIYTGSAYANFIQYAIEEFGAKLNSAIQPVYDKEINIWDFPNPKNIDLNNYLDIYTINENKSSCSSYNDHSQCNAITMGFQYAYDLSSLPYLQPNTNNLLNYSTVDNLIESILSHEFFHAIQYHYPNIFEVWGEYNDEEPIIDDHFITEGMAVFIQSAYLPLQEFKPGNYFNLQANDYLRAGLNTSLTELEYDYCLFWRYLAEQTMADTVGNIDPSLLISYLQSLNSEAASENDPVEGFMDALSDNALLGADWEETYIPEFAKHCYFTQDLIGGEANSFWDPCPSDFYEPVPTDTFELPNVELAGQIPNCFGIDYFEAYNYDNSGIFNNNSGDKGTITLLIKDEAKYNLNIIKIDEFDQIMENEINIISEYSHPILYSEEINLTGVEKVICIVTRLDNVNNYYDGNYEICFNTISISPKNAIQIPDSPWGINEPQLFYPTSEQWYYVPVNIVDEGQLFYCIPNDLNQRGYTPTLSLYKYCGPEPTSVYFIWEGFSEQLFLDEYEQCPIDSIGGNGDEYGFDYDVAVIEMNETVLNQC